MNRSLVPIAIGVLTVLGLSAVGFMWPGPTLRAGTETGGVNPRAILQIIISLALLIGSMFVILSSKYVEADKKWAYGTIGTLLGFWLKGE